MGILIFIFAAVLFWRRISKTDRKTSLILLFSLVGYIAFSLILNMYLEYQLGWEYGVSGVDLSAYFECAQAIQDGTKLKELADINFRFELRFSNIGYIAYAYFLYLVSFAPTIFSIRFSLQIMYTVQSMAAICAALNIAEFFAPSPDEKKKRNSILAMLLLCVAVSQMAVVLMRDIWIFFFISLLMKYCTSEMPAKWKCIAVILVTTMLRSYSLIITVPIFVAYGLKRKKLSVIISGVFLAVFFAGQFLIDWLAGFMHILWEYSYSFDLMSTVEYILFPNIMTQTANVQHLAHGYHEIFGGNTEWIYYLLACWNVYTFPIMAYGGLCCIKKRRFSDTALWGVMILNIAMLYAVFYSSVSEPRHKIMLIYALAFFFGEGFSKITFTKKVVYILGITLFLLLLFLFIN